MESGWKLADARRVYPLYRNDGAVFWLQPLPGYPLKIHIWLTPVNPPSFFLHLHIFSQLLFFHLTFADGSPIDFLYKGGVRDFLRFHSRMLHCHGALG